MAAVSAAGSQSSRPRHRKRISVSRLSSDTTATLPEYSSPYRNSLVGVEPFEQPPEYPDSAEEADEETDDLDSLPVSPPISPRRRKFYRSVSQPRIGKHIYANPTTQSDTFLDSLLERSINALELSNTLLQSSMSTQNSLSTVFGSDSAATDHMLDSSARVLTTRIRDNHGVHERWMDDLDILARDVESLCDDGTKHKSRGVAVAVRGKLEPDENSAYSRSLPSSGLAKPRSNHRRPSLELRKYGDSRLESGRLQLTLADQHRLQSHPPRALTQYVSVGSECGDTLEHTSDPSSIYLPSTIGLRTSSHVSDFTPSHPLSPPPSAPPSAAYASFMRHANSSPASSRSSRLSRSPTPTYRPRSRSRSSNQTSSPQMLPRLLPPPIEELPSQSDSSTSDTSPHPFRTVESLRKILDEQPMPPPPDSISKPESRSASLSRSHSFNPRSPPVAPVISTFTTTTSISRLFTKGSHSTSTRAPSPPRQSSLKQRPSPLHSAGPSTLSVPELVSPGASRTSSGRSTPRNVAFGPLPEPHRPEGAPSKFQEQREARARSKSRSKSGREAKRNRKDDKENGKEGESSWWTTWLTGGSGLSMSASRQEERAEDRIARSWGRPGMGPGFEDWPV